MDSGANENVCRSLTVAVLKEATGLS